MSNPDDVQDSLVIFYDSKVREIEIDEYEELQEEFSDLLQVA